MAEVKKCPKCNGEMVQAELLKNLPKVVVSPKKGRRHFDRSNIRKAKIVLELH